MGHGFCFRIIMNAKSGIYKAGGNAEWSALRPLRTLWIENLKISKITKRICFPMFPLNLIWCLLFQRGVVWAGARDFLEMFYNRGYHKCSKNSPKVIPR